MRIATWNINGMRARMDLLIAWLRDRKPDVVGLQELKMQDDKFPHETLKEEGYLAHVYGQKAWNGVAVLTRGDSLEVQKGLPGQDEFGSRLLSVKTGDLVFTTIYVPNGKSVEHDDYSRKLGWFDDLIKMMKKKHKPDASQVLCGDFNICPTPLDSWDEEKMKGGIFHTEQERVRYQALLEWGYKDLYREKHPDTQAFSWWDYRGGSFPMNHGLRIDFLLGTESVSSRLKGVIIDRDYRKKIDGLTPSDHVPVIADLS